ncbi:MAG: HlyD family efflux transporter periplasmic adaptor subunit [Bacillota bacterium]
MRKRLYIVVLVLVVGAVLFQLSRPKALEVEVAMAETGPVVKSISETGYLAPVREQTLFAETQFLVKQVAVEEGDRLPEGSLILVGDTEDLRLELAMADARFHAARARFLTASEFDVPLEIRSAEAELEAAKVEYERALEDYNELLEVNHIGLVKEEEWNLTRDRYNIAAARLKGAEAALRRAVGQASPEGLERYQAEMDAISLEMESLRAEMDKCVIQAPFDCVVASLEVDEGSLVLPGAPLASVYSGELMVRCEVLARDMPQIRLGQEVVVSGDALGGQVIPGRISKIYPQAVESLSELGLRQRRVPVEILLNAPSDRGALPGYPVDVDIVVHSSTSLRVPKRAVFEIDGTKHVFVVVNDRAQLAPVEAGAEGGDYVEVISGLSEGTAVLVSWPSEIAPGARVTLK